MTSAAIAIAFSALFVFNHRAAPGYGTGDLVRLATLSVTAGATALPTPFPRADSAANKSCK